MRRKSRQRSGDLQIAVMHVLWDRGEATLPEIRAALGQDRVVASTTIATVLSRLEQAGLIAHSGGERSRIWAPKVARVDFQRSHTQSLVDRLFGGRASDLVAHLVRDVGIDDAELESLRRMLKKRGSK